MRCRKIVPRNITLAVILKNDPKRVSQRTVETEPRKLVKNRTRRKRIAKKILF